MATESEQTTGGEPSKPPGTTEGAFHTFYAEVKAIEARDSVLTSKQQIDRLTRPGATYFNLNPFDVLQCDPDLPIADIKKRYRQMSILVHPDKNPEDNERAQKSFEAVNKAYKTLENEEGFKRCREIIDEAQSRVDEMVKQKKKQLKKEGKPQDIPEDYPDKKTEQQLERKKITLEGFEIVDKDHHFLVFCEWRISREQIIAKSSVVSERYGDEDLNIVLPLEVTVSIQGLRLTVHWINDELFNLNQYIPILILKDHGFKTRKHAIYVQTCKLFADLERMRQEREMKDMHERKRKAEEEEVEEEMKKQKAEWNKNFEETRTDRVQSWRSWKSGGKKSKGAFRPPKHKAESR